MLHPGDTIGDWQIVLPLGRGGMGAVYRCRHLLSERIEAAVKVLEPTSVHGSRARFIREAEALHALRHPAIVRLTGFGEDARTGLLFLAMELVAGEDFERLLHRGAFPRERASQIFAALASGLDYAHSRGVVHRDLKPGNLMLQADGSPVLLDFGIAVQQGRDRLTQEGVVPGTVAYASPEQLVDGVEPNPKLADVYALGQVLCECVRGEVTYPLDPSVNDHQRSLQILRTKMKIGPLDPGAGVRPAVRELVRTATAPDPSRRGPPLAEWPAILTRSEGREPSAADEDQTALQAAPGSAGRSSDALPLDLALPGEPAPRLTDAETVTQLSLTGTAVRIRRTVGWVVGSAGLVVVVGVVAVGVVAAVALGLWWAGLPGQGSSTWPAIDEEPPPPAFRLGDVLELDARDLEDIEAEAERRASAGQASRDTRSPASPVRPARTASAEGEVRLVLAADMPATIWIDGEERRESPTVLRLSPGRYRVELRARDGARRTFPVTLRVGEVTRRIWSFADGEWRSFEGGIDGAGLPRRPALGSAQARLQRADATQACFAGVEDAAPVRFSFVVVPDGTVVADGVQGATRGDDLDRCLRDAVRQLSFEPSATGAAVTVELRP